MDIYLIKFWVKTSLLLLTLGILFGYYWKFKKGKTSAPILDGLLIVVSIASVVIYFNLGQFRFNHYMNPHDVYHYYIGAKYSDELGYNNLYRCSLIADHEMKKVYPLKSNIRNLDDYSYESVRSVLKKNQDCKKYFSQDRWQEFKKDIQFFQNMMPTWKWQRLLRDKGYNPPPVWNMTGKILANLASTDSGLAINLLVGLDLFFLTLMFGFIWWAFGFRPMLFSLIFYCLNFMVNFVHIQGAFLRLEWLALMVIAICLYKKEFYKVSGIAFSYAVMSRVFPAIFVFGLGSKMLWDFWENRKLSKRYLSFFLAFFISLSALGGLTILESGGTKVWQDFSKKIALHDQDFSTTRVGFKYLFINSIDRTEKSWNQYVERKKNEFRDKKEFWWFLQVLVLLVTFFLVRRASDVESFAFSFIPFFFLASPTFYYYVLLALPFFIFATNYRDLNNLKGMLFMILITIVAFISNRFYKLDLTLSYILSWMMLGFCIFLIFNTRESIFSSVSKFKENLIKIFGVSVFFVILGLIISYQPNHFELHPKKNELVLTFGGDVMLDRNVRKSVEERGGNYSFLVEKIKSFFEPQYLVFFNLETAVSHQGIKIDKRYRFNSQPKSLQVLSDMKVDVVSLANNHTLDFGEAAAIDTQKNLDKIRIKHLGLTKNEAPQVPVILEENGIKVGYLAYADHKTPYAYAKEFDQFELRPAKAIENNIKKDIKALKAQVDILVVSLHWGIEYQTKPNKRQKQLGRFVIDQGADIVAGHHPHVQQEAELYKKGIIIYSMGNFIFDQWMRPNTRKLSLYRVIVDKNKINYVDYISLKNTQHSWQPISDLGYPVIIKNYLQ